MLSSDRLSAITHIIRYKIRKQTLEWKLKMYKSWLFFWHYMRISSNRFQGYLKGKLRRMRTSIKVVILVFSLGILKYAIDGIFTTEEDLYVYTSPEELKLDKTALSATFVLVVGYGRTGSSWIGEILSKADESFYVFEPMQRPLAEGYYLKHLVAFNDNTYRKPLNLLERHDFMITTIHRIFTCQFSKLHPFSQEILVRHQIRMYNGTFKYCMNFESYRCRHCISELEAVCLSRTHRIVKTIRISMELVSDMIALWPNMKVVNLVRDPRAITDSRMRGADFKMAFNILGHSADMCTRMYEDIKYDWYIQKKHPKTLIILSYEAFADSPYAATGYVYDFLNLLFREKTWFWVYNSMRNQTTDMDYYATLRFNSSKVANRWRKHLDYKIVQEIDFSCTEVYKALGYVPMQSEEHLRSDTMSSRRKIDTLEGFM